MNFEKYFKYVYFIIAIACFIVAIVDTVMGNHLQAALDVLLLLIVMCFIDINYLKERIGYIGEGKKY